MAISPLMWAIFTVVLLPPGGHDSHVILQLTFFLYLDFSIGFDFDYFQQYSVEPKEDIKVF